MAANNVKTGFSLSSGVNEDFIKDLMQQHHQQQQHQKISSNNNNNNNNKISTNLHQKVFGNIRMKRPVLESLFNKVLGLQPIDLSKRGSDTVFSCAVIKNTFFYRSPPDDYFWNRPSGTVLIQ